jgi:hypothetical protein
LSGSLIKLGYDSKSAMTARAMSTKKRSSP